MSLAVYLGLLAIAIGVGAIIARGPNPRHWPMAGVVAVAVGLYGHLHAVDWASWCAVAIAFVGFVVPGLLGARLRRVAASGDFHAAARWARRLAHLRRTWRPWVRVFDAVAARADGDDEAATALLAELTAADDGKAHALREALISLTHDWPKARYASSLDVQARALCELGDVELGIETAGPLWRSRMGWASIRRSRAAMLGPLAFAGQIDTVETLCGLLRLPPGPRALWRATTLAAAGDHAGAVATLDELERLPISPSVRASATERRGNLPNPVALSPGAQMVIDAAIAEVQAGHLIRAQAFWRVPVITTLMGGLAAGFVFQAVRGGSQDPFVALSLGALVAKGHLPYESWRLLAYGFLHFGWLHLATNTLGLAVLGPIITRQYGAIGALAIFFLGIILAGMGISVFGAHGITIGASAGVMALMGALVIGCRWHPVLESTRSGRAVSRILVVLMLLQTALDAITPMVSSIGHGVGALVGVGVGALFFGVSRRSE